MLFYDFYYYYAAGRMLLRGDNPYDLNAFAAELHACGWPIHEFPNGFFFVPWTVYWFAPLGFFSFPVALAIWTLLTILFVGLVVRDLLALCPKLNSLSLPRLLVLLLFFMPLTKQLLYGNTTFIPFAAFYLAMALFRRNRWFGSGIALSFVTIKPHLLLPLELVLCLLALRRERLSFFVGGILGVFAQLVVSLLFAPQIVSFFLERGDSWNRSQLSPSASLVRVLASQLGLPSVATAAAIVSLLLGVLLVKREPQRVPQLYLIFIPLSLCLSPYSWSHDFIFFLPAHLLLLNFALPRFGYGAVCAASAVVFLASSFFLTGAMLEQFLCVYSPVFLGIGLFLSSRITTPSTSS